MGGAAVDETPPHERIWNRSAWPCFSRAKSAREADERAGGGARACEAKDAHTPWRL